MADDTENTTNDDVQDSPDTLGDAGKKAIQAERRAAQAATRERDALAAKLKEFEDRDKTEQERLTERADAAEKRAQELEARALRLEVASEQGLNAAQAKRLVGSTREELEADAKELLETFKPAVADDATTALVAESLDLGARGSTPIKGKSTADLFAAAVDGSFTR